MWASARLSIGSITGKEKNVSEGLYFAVAHKLFVLYSPASIVTKSKHRVGGPLHPDNLPRPSDFVGEISVAGLLKHWLVKRGQIRATEAEGELIKIWHLFAFFFCCVWSEE